MRSASSASYWRHSSQSSFALLVPIRSRRSEAPKPPSQDPTLGPVCPNQALSAAIVRSQQRWRTWPPPIAYPATIATTGFGSRRICTWRSVTWKRPSEAPSAT